LINLDQYRLYCFSPGLEQIFDGCGSASLRMMYISSAMALYHRYDAPGQSQFIITSIYRRAAHLLSGDVET
jgi:hypothetical protein